jgi:hypothetical protein
LGKKTLWQMPRTLNYQVCITTPLWWELARLLQQPRRQKFPPAGKELHAIYVYMLQWSNILFFCLKKALQNSDPNNPFDIKKQTINKHSVIQKRSDIF